MILEVAVPAGPDELHLRPDHCKGPEGAALAEADIAEHNCAGMGVDGLIEIGETLAVVHCLRFQKPSDAE
jgi:hypothetical protein